MASLEGVARVADLCQAVNMVTPDGDSRKYALFSHAHDARRWTISVTDARDRWFEADVDTATVERLRGITGDASVAKFFERMQQAIKGGLLDVSEQAGKCVLSIDAVNFQGLTIELPVGISEALFELVDGYQVHGSSTRARNEDGESLMDQLRKYRVQIAELQTQLSDRNNVSTQNLSDIPKPPPRFNAPASAAHAVKRKPGASLVNPYTKSRRRARGAQFGDDDDPADGASDGDPAP